MNRRHFLSMPLAAAQRRPLNFLVILADDIGAKELACYGNQKHRTPNLDALARGGVQFQTCYATPICHPTRVEILTGQYGSRNGVHNFAGRRGGPDENAPVENMRNHYTFGRMLKERGYETALAGKWQLSGTYPDIVRETGFAEYCIWAFENYVSPEDRPRYRARERYWEPAIMKNGKLIPTTKDDYGPNIYSDYLADFIRRKRDRPFLAYYPMALTHGPHVPSPDTVKADADKHVASKANYKGAVEYMDKIVGKMVKALEDAGVRENTVILYTGDNGTAGEGKGDPTELGARVPMIANCPGLIPARPASPELMDLSDFFPTLAAFAGAPLPRGKRLDGRSLAGYLRGESPAPREWIHSFIADRRIFRTKRFLLEDNSPLHWGRLYDCGSSRDGTGYREVTGSSDPEVKKARSLFDRLIADLPVPHEPEEGHPTDKKRAKA